MLAGRLAAEIRAEALIKSAPELVGRTPIRAFIEYEYQGTGTPVEEVKKCLDTAKSLLKA